MSVRVTTFLAPALFAFAQLAAVAALAAETEHGSEDDAQEMVRGAVDLIKTQGTQRAYDAFTNRPGSTFKDRDLYIFVYDFNGSCLAHGANPNMVGKNMSTLLDAGGNNAMHGAVNMVRAKGAGWYGPYKFTDPATKKTEVKKSYCKRGDGETMVCAAVYSGQP